MFRKKTVPLSSRRFLPFIVSVEFAFAEASVEEEMLRPAIEVEDDPATPTVPLTVDPIDVSTTLPTLPTVWVVVFIMPPTALPALLISPPPEPLERDPRAEDAANTSLSAAAAVDAEEDTTEVTIPEIGISLPPDIILSNMIDMLEEAFACVFFCTSVTLPTSREPLSMTVWPFCLTAWVVFRST
jgi:hypothetical protein